MDLVGWNERYRSRRDTAEDLDAAPTRLLVETAAKLPPGTALDLACGTGRNALWLAGQGWRVTAVDGAEVAIEVLRSRAGASGRNVDTRVADLTSGEYRIEPQTSDLIAICYYLQRDLLESAKLGLRERGVVLVIVHIAEPGEEPSDHRLAPGELERYFAGWEILHRYEGQPRDATHRRSVAEIVARRLA